MKSLGILNSLVFAACMSLAPAAHADEPHGVEPHGRRLELIKEKLNLTDDQAGKIREIFVSRRGKCAQQTDPDSARLCRRENWQDGKQEIDAILTPQQREKFQQFREERRAQRQERRENPECVPRAHTDGGQL